MHITKREILFSVIIILFMLLFGIIIHGNINDNLMLKYQEYNTALQVENDSDLFVYGMKTNVGNAFVYGDLKAVDTVTYPEIGGEYSYIKKIKEEYTRHTRTVTYTDDEGNTQTEIEVYWTWDEVGRWSKHCEKISFLGVEFDYETIKFPYADYITTKKESSEIRYKYYGTGIEYVGTIYTVLSDDTISETNLYNNRSIAETIEELESGWQLVLFWVMWILLTGSCVYGLYRLDNWWLEDRH